MKILHIASFSGNVGDIINHEGFYSSIMGRNIEVKQLEIRKFYRNAHELEFDQSILKKINTFDGLILGGGGFFDVRWDDSQTGTTFDMSPKFIKDIRVPVLVNSMGVHIDYTKIEAIKRFRSFVDNVSNNPRWMVTLRNDGSIKRLKSIMGLSDTDISVVPDNGFAYSKMKYKGKNRFVGLSITNDLFTREFNENMNEDCFNRKIAELCEYILGEDNDIIFFLHAPQDIDVLHKLYRLLGNERFRNRIRVAPYDVYTRNNADNLNRLYSTCKYVIAMRFHANVIAIKNAVPVIGLAGHEQISGLYDEIGLSDQCVIVRDNFFSKLINLVDLMNAKQDMYSKIEAKVINHISVEQKTYSHRVRDFFKFYQ